MKSELERKIYDCAVIGAGPGGLVSALYLGRYKRSTIVISSGTPRAFWIPRIRNLIGYTNGLTGKQLLTRLSKQVAKLKTEFVDGEAEVHRSGPNFEIRFNHQQVVSRKVIIATGMKDHQPQIENWQELRAVGALGYCPICDGFEHSDQPVGILVNNPQGLKKIKFIARFTSDLHVIPLQKITLSPFYKNLFRKLKVKWYPRPPRKFSYLTRQKNLEISWPGRKKLRVKLAYVGLGTKVPQKAFRNFKNLRKTKDGFLLTNSHQETSVPGMYAVGDCVHALSQVSVAVGHAAVAATDIHNKLSQFI